VLGRLDEAAADCHRFAFRIGTRTFVGATPETLVRKRGIRLDTEALAGSRPRSLAGAEIELLESDKDRLEHKLVVDSIVSTIAPISSELEHLPTPVVRRLRRIIHLHTPITATLRAPLDVLEVVALLHPTPAVGGFPRNAALAWLEKNEAVERGWYASPFGFVTRGGDGHFVVALRSALVNGDRVHLFAGAGIVDRSNPAEEFAETELKMTAMRSALGLPEPAHDAL
jgi:salicylate biosynthesis isochorismate synthase